MKAFFLRDLIKTILLRDGSWSKPEIVVFKDGFYHDITGLIWDPVKKCYVLSTELKREWLSGIESPQGQQDSTEKNSRT